MGRVGRVAVIAGTAVALACVAFVLRYGVFLDPTAWFMARAFDQRGSLPTEAELQALHRGPRPCLRYPGPIAASEIDAAANDLEEAGLSPEQVGGLVGRFVSWNDDREDAAHEGSMLAENMRAQGALPRLVVWLNDGRLRRQDKARMAEVVSRAEAVEKTLTAAQQASVRKAWQDHPVALTVRGLVAVIGKMRQRRSEARVSAASEAVLAWASKSSRLPVRLEEAGLSGEKLLDGWGYPLQYEPAGDSARVASLGRDQVVGGVGQDADIVRTVSLNGGEVACGELPSQAEVEGAEVDRILSNLEPIATQARLVPAFVDGKAIGFKLLQIAPRSIYERIGLCNGDVVAAVAGVPLTSPDQALNLYESLKGKREVAIRVLRQGRDGEILLQIR